MKNHTAPTKSVRNRFRLGVPWYWASGTILNTGPLGFQVILSAKGLNGIGMGPGSEALSLMVKFQVCETCETDVAHQRNIPNYLPTFFIFISRYNIRLLEIPPCESPWWFLYVFVIRKNFVATRHTMAYPPCRSACRLRSLRNPPPRARPEMGLDRLVRSSVLGPWGLVELQWILWTDSGNIMVISWI